MKELTIPVNAKTLTLLFIISCLIGLPILFLLSLLDNKAKYDTKEIEKMVGVIFDAGYKAGQTDSLNNVWQYKKIDVK